MHLPRFKRCHLCGKLILFARWTKTEKLVTKTLEVDGNRTDEYIEDGSPEKPFKTIAQATAVAATWTTISDGWIWYHTTCFEDKQRGVATIGKLF